MEKREKKRDNRGMTLVEIICAVAIFSLISATIGGVLVMTSRSYRNGSMETAVQQEAQFAANRIGDIVQDAIEASFTGGTNATGSFGRLVLSNGTNKYVVELADGDNRLMYGEALASVADADVTGTDLLADNILSFYADTSKFAESKAVRLDMTVEEDGREYVLSYNMTARNDDVTLEAIPAIRTAAIIAESRVILEPGQTDFEIPVNVIGSSRGIEAVSTDEAQVHVTSTMDSIKVSLEKTAGETNSAVNINVSTKEKNGDGTPLATSTICIQIRRVDEMTVTSTLLEGEEGMAGAKYKFTTALTRYTPYLAKKAGAAWDVDYKNPYAVQWNYDSNYVINGTAADFNEYFEVVEKEEDIDTPYLILKLKKNLVVGSTLTVEGVSKHAAIDGGNKSGTAYNTEVKASATIVGPTLRGVEDIVLEPGETYSVSLPIAECDITTTPDASTLAGKGTTMSFAAGEFKIKLGKDEKGDTNGQIKIELRAKNDTDISNVRTIYISVRRLNEMTLELKQLTSEGHPVKDPLLRGADYQFATRMTGTNMKKTAEEQESDYLPNPYAVEFSWEFWLNGVKITGLPGISGTVIWDKYEYYEKTGKYTLEYSHAATNPGNQYFRLVDLGTNSEQPCINFALKQDFPDNAQLIVTAKALHPAGKDSSGVVRNQTGEAYIEGEMIAVAVLEGKKTTIIDPDDPFDDNEIDFLDNVKRGQDFTNFPDFHEKDNFPWSEADWNKTRWFMRVREIIGKDADGNILYGPWSEYRRMLEGSPDNKKLGAEETRSFIADKRYQLEMALITVDRDSQTIYWPYDDSLFEAGTGFESYKKGWSAGKAQTAKDVYSSTYNIGRACITFKKDGTSYKCIGSLDNPVVLHPGGSFQIDLDGYTIEYGHYQGKCYARVQELVGNTWVEVGNKGWTIQDRSSFFLMKDIQDSAKGTYRVSFKVIDNGGAGWTEFTGTMWEPKYTRFQNTEYLLCGSNGTAGYIYIRIE